MIEKELAKILKIFLYSAFSVTLAGLLLYTFHYHGKFLIEVGVFIVLLAPLAEFIALLLHGVTKGKKKFVLISVWMMAVFLFSSLKFFIFH